MTHLTLAILLHYLRKLKKFNFSADVEENANKLFVNVHQVGLATITIFILHDQTQKQSISESMNQSISQSVNQ